MILLVLRNREFIDLIVRSSYISIFLKGFVEFMIYYAYSKDKVDRIYLF